MSQPKVVPVTVLRGGRSALPPSGVADRSEEAQWLFDREVRRAVEEAHAHVSSLLSEQREQLDSLAGKLLEAETLAVRDAYAAVGMPMRIRLAPEGETPPSVAGVPAGGRDVRCGLRTRTTRPAGVPYRHAPARRARAGLVAGYLRELRTGTDSRL